MKGGWVDGEIRCVDGWMDGWRFWMDGWMDEGWMMDDGWMESLKKIDYLFYFISPKREHKKLLWLTLAELGIWGKLWWL